MTTISIIGSGNMATAVGTRAAKHGHTIELMSRNTAPGSGTRRPDRQRSHRRRATAACCSARTAFRSGHMFANPGSGSATVTGPKATAASREAWVWRMVRPGVGVPLHSHLDGRW